MRYPMKIGAEEETRTPTGLRPPDPEPGASTSSATSAPINFWSIASTVARVKGENATRHHPRSVPLSRAARHVFTAK